jgi:hypothetical protein
MSGGFHHESKVCFIFYIRRARLCSTSSQSSHHHSSSHLIYNHHYSTKTTSHKTNSSLKMLSPKVFLVSLLAASGAMAAPAPVPEEAVSMMATTWTFTNAKRTCGSKGLQCTWSFGIVSEAGTTQCSFNIKGDPAFKAPGSGKCGPYTVSSGWSDQFGAENAFTTIAVADQAKKLIAYPAYTDKEVNGGKVVKPDRKYPVQTY